MGLQGAGVLTDRDRPSGWTTPVPVLALLIKDRVLSVALLGAALLHVILSGLGLILWRCPLYGALGLRCPGCGLTRAVRSLVRGDLAAGMRLHPFAPMFVAGGALLGVCCLLPESLSTRVADGLACLERRTGLTVILLSAFLLHGLVRMLIQA